MSDFRSYPPYFTCVFTSFSFFSFFRGNSQSPISSRALLIVPLPLCSLVLCFCAPSAPWNCIDIDIHSCSSLPACVVTLIFGSRRLQPHAETRQRQVSLWKEEIKAHCARSGITTITLGERASHSLTIFSNYSINRSLSESTVRSLLQSLCDDSDGEWLDGRSDAFIIWWKSPQGWADELVTWARERGMDNEVITVHEVISDPGEGNLAAASETVLLRAARALEDSSRGRFLPGSEECDPSFKITI